MWKLRRDFLWRKYLNYDLIGIYTLDELVETHITNTRMYIEYGYEWSRSIKFKYKINIKILSREIDFLKGSTRYLYFPPSSQLLYLCFCPVGLSLL